jgi:hypothetical protein
MPERGHSAVTRPLWRAGVLALCLAILPARSEGVRPENLRIAYTAETRGNLLPCACPGQPLGGLARRIGFLDSLRAAPGGPLLVVDAGRFLPDASDYPLLPSGEFLGLLALHEAAAEEAGYDAIVLEGNQRSAPSGPRWLKPNEARLVDRQGLRIGLVAVDEWTDSSPARRALRSLGDVDLVVLLCSGDLSLAANAAPALGAQIAVVSRGAHLREPLVRDGVLYLGPGHAGKHVGLADCGISPRGGVRALSVKLRPMDGGTPPQSVWAERVEQTVLRVERSHPSALSQGE